MSEFIKRRVEAYQQRISTEARSTAGVDLDALRVIVRSEPPEVTELVIRMGIEGYQAGAPEKLALALTVAMEYAQAFGDDKLVNLVRTAADGETIPWTMSTPDGGRQTIPTRLGPARMIGALVIDDQDPRVGGVERAVRMIRELEQEPARAGAFRGQMVLSFPRHDADPRPNFAIPEIRAYVTALDAQLPYLLYFLMPERQVGQVQNFVNSLLPLQHFDLVPGSWTYTGPTDDLVDVLFPRLHFIRTFCTMTEDDPDEVTGAILQTYPEPLAKAIETGLRGTDGS